ncbi:GntR family transcriptional regulator [Gordonia desulfuricans]|uniref:GntR family transcriptional regulator n=1 Tax=Gordonia desulfuricans TaxID=89051 RepID=A0A7K3LNG9_9ACTN|nr:GntR family transcriptional regulator [Gordonia desulfuricans]NDK89804.1 GntR family transcriptional regulator [Gordonia desulfuricans]
MASRTGSASDDAASHGRITRELLRLARDASADRVPLAGEMDLVDRLHCTRQQLRKAMADLERQGLLRRRQGAATVVDPLALRMSVRLEEQFEHTELLERLGYEARVEIVAETWGSLPADVAALLDCDPGAPCVHTTKRWFADDLPVMIATGYLLVPDAEPTRLDDSVFTAVAQAWGESLVWEVATPGADVLDAESAALLDMSAGDPVMTLELIGVAASGRRLFYASELHRPDIVRYSLVRTVRPPWQAGPSMTS